MPPRSLVCTFTAALLTHACHTHACPSCVQASDRVYYLYQTLADIGEAVAATPEGQAALAEAAQRLAGDRCEQGRSAGQGRERQGGRQGGRSAAGRGNCAPVLAPFLSLSTLATRRRHHSPGGEVLAEVRGALADDLNTPLAMAAFSAPLRAANDLLQTKKVGRSKAGAVRCPLRTALVGHLPPPVVGSAPSRSPFAGLGPRPFILSACASLHLSAPGQEGAWAAADAGQLPHGAAVLPGAAGSVGGSAGRGAAGAAPAGIEAVGGSGAARLSETWWCGRRCMSCRCRNQATPVVPTAEPEESSQWCCGAACRWTLHYHIMPACPPPHTHSSSLREQGRGDGAADSGSD